LDWKNANGTRIFFHHHHDQNPKGLISHIYIKKGSGFPGKYRGKQKQRQQGGSKVAVCEEKEDCVKS
jgi:hypothetical protein